MVVIRETSTGREEWLVGAWHNQGTINFISGQGHTSLDHDSGIAWDWPQATINSWDDVSQESYDILPVPSGWEVVA